MSTRERRETGPTITTTQKVLAEFIGTAVLVVVAVGVATLSFGFKLMGSSPSAGIVATALAFGMTLLALVYAIGATSGCHVNPAVTLGFVVSGRMSIIEAVGYWAAQFTGGIVGALILWAIVSGSPAYSRTGVGLGADGFGHASMVHLDAAGAFTTETVLTFVFVFVVLSATSRLGSPGFAGLAIGLALTAVHLVGIPLTGTSVNPARSLGPALILGHTVLSQIWVFILAPLLGAVIAAILHRVFVTVDPVVARNDPDVIAERQTGKVPGTP